MDTQPNLNIHEAGERIGENETGENGATSFLPVRYKATPADVNVYMSNETDVGKTPPMIFPSNFDND